MKSIVLPVLVSMLLVSCSTVPKNKQAAAIESPTHKEFVATDFVFSYPSNLINRIVRDDKSIVLIGNNITEASLGSDDYFITIYNHLSESCRIASGVSTMIESANKVQWGKVDYFNVPNMEHNRNEPAPLCAQLGGEHAASYAFCPQNNNKVVLICISLKTDNPELAKQIFESFRWTDTK